MAEPILLAHFLYRLWLYVFLMLGIVPYMALWAVGMFLLFYGLERLLEKLFGNKLDQNSKLGVRPWVFSKLCTALFFLWYTFRCLVARDDNWDRKANGRFREEGFFDQLNEMYMAVTLFGCIALVATSIAIRTGYLDLTHHKYGRHLH